MGMPRENRYVRLGSRLPCERQSIRRSDLQPEEKRWLFEDAS
jgi:hypothetical protein